MLVPKTRSELDQLVAEKVEESLRLEFKQARALDRQKVVEISKDVSAMANSAGGVIIYGLAEEGHCAGRITPISRREYSPDWLSQIILSSIQPKIEGVIIHPISLSEDEVVYVVEIPQSATAHQAKDNRYHRRHNSVTAAMEDYEIRDVMNRVRHPIVEPLIRIVRKTEHVEGEFDPRVIMQKQRPVKRHYLQVRPKNQGYILAQYVYFEISLPDGLAHNDAKLLTGDNTRQDIVGRAPNPVGPGAPKYGPRWYEPILPELQGPPAEIRLVDRYDDKFHGKHDAALEWRCFADSAPCRAGRILLKDIPRSDSDDDNGR